MELRMRRTCGPHEEEGVALAQRGGQQERVARRVLGRDDDVRELRAGRDLGRRQLLAPQLPPCMASEHVASLTLDTLSPSANMTPCPAGMHVSMVKIII